MRFVVIEDFGMPSLVTDEEGNVKIFYTIEEATEEAKECQNGIVAPLTSPLDKLNTIIAKVQDLNSNICDIEKNLEELKGRVI